MIKRYVIALILSMPILLFCQDDTRQAELKMQEQIDAAQIRIQLQIDEIKDMLFIQANYPDTIYPICPGESDEVPVFYLPIFPLSLLDFPLFTIEPKEIK